MVVKSWKVLSSSFNTLPGHISKELWVAQAAVGGELFESPANLKPGGAMKDYTIARIVSVFLISLGVAAIAKVWEEGIVVFVLGGFLIFAGLGGWPDNLDSH